MRLDRVNAVAIGANRRLPISLGQGGAVDALSIFLRNRIVALTASECHVELEDRRLRILGIENLVRAMAIGANGGLVGTGRNRVPVNALLVRRDHLRA